MTLEKTRDVIEPSPITGEYLTRIFQDGRFASNLRRMYEIKDFETMFKVGQRAYEISYDFGVLRLGNSRNCGDSISLDEDDDREILGPFPDSWRSNNPLDQINYDLVWVHTHLSGGFVPSYPCSDYWEGDLLALLETRASMIRYPGVDARPIMGILPLKQGRSRKMLIIQEKVPVQDYEELVDMAGFFDSHFSDFGLSPEKVAEILRSTGKYNAGVVRWDRTFKERNLECLSEFAFVPKVLNQKP